MFFFLLRLSLDVLYCTLDCTPSLMMPGSGDTVGSLSQASPDVEMMKEGVQSRGYPSILNDKK